MGIFNKINRSNNTKEENQDNITEDVYGSKNTTNSEQDDLYESIYEEAHSQDEHINIYEEQDECEENTEVSTQDIKNKLSMAAKSGHIIVVTGSRGSGLTTVSYNLASTIASLGYKTAIIDMDTEQRAQSHITKDSFNATGNYCNNLINILSKGADIASNTSIIKKNLYLIGLGAAIDANKIEDVADNSSISRLVGELKMVFDFVIYDIPIENLISRCEAAAFMANTILVVSDSSTCGIMNTINSITNIEKELLLTTILGKGNLVFNRARNKIKFMGKNIDLSSKILKTIDSVIMQIAEEDIGVHFSEFNSVCKIEYNEENQNLWHTNKSIVDTNRGLKEYIKLINKVI